MSNKVDMSSYGRSGEAFRFDTEGAMISGEIVAIKEPHDRVNQFTDADEVMMAITILTDEGDEFSVWPRVHPYSALGGAISEAAKPHGGNIEKGGKLAVKYTGDKDVGKGFAAKMYSASYQPPEPGAAAPDDPGVTVTGGGTADNGDDLPF